MSINDADAFKNRLNECLNVYGINEITREGFAGAMGVYASNKEFFMLTGGREADINTSVNDCEAVPPGFDAVNKIYAGISENGMVLGILDLLIGYPSEGHVWIGLLLVHGDMHGQGIGGRVARAVISVSKEMGFKSVRLGVIKSNANGLKFWGGLGFTVTGETEDGIIKMEKGFL